MLMLVASHQHPSFTGTLTSIEIYNYQKHDGKIFFVGDLLPMICLKNFWRFVAFPPSSSDLDPDFQDPTSRVQF